MSTRIPTFAGLIKRQLEYREENVFGEGIDISSGTLKSAGHIKSIDPKIEIVLEEFRRLGSEDIYKSIKLAENYRFTVTYAIEDIEFLKYGINSQGSSNSIELKANADSLIEVTSEFICKEISTPNTTDYVSGTATHATDLTNNPWHFADATDPVRLVSGASTTILPCTSLTIKINRNLDPIRTLGSQQITFLPATNRDITGSITLLYLSTSREVDLKSSNAYTLRWILKEGTGGAVLDLTNTVFTSLDKREFNASDNKAILETLGFRAKGATIYTT